MRKKIANILFLLLFSKTAIAATHQVIIQNFRYVPETLEVEAGDTVVWVNEDRAPHTVTAAEEGGFDSARMGSGVEFSKVFHEPGPVEYFCDFHRGMRGQVIVSSPGESQ